MKRIFFFLSLVLFCTNFFFTFFCLMCISSGITFDAKTFVFALTVIEGFFCGVVGRIILSSNMRIYGIRTENHRFLLVFWTTLAVFLGLLGVALTSPDGVEEAFAVYSPYTGEKESSEFIIMPWNAFLFMVGGYIFSWPAVFVGRRILKRKRKEVENE